MSEQPQPQQPGLHRTGTAGPPRPVSSPGIPQVVPAAYPTAPVSTSSASKESHSGSSSSRSRSRHEPVDSDSEEDFIQDPKAVYERNRAKKPLLQEKAAALSHNPPTGTPWNRFSEDLPVEEGANKTWYKLQPGETFIQGLKKLDPGLVSKARNDHTAFAIYTVLEGEIGKALHHGRTKFYGPGNYAALGPGKSWLGAEKLRKENATDVVVHQDVTLISLSENQLIVVQIGKSQYPIGSGQYIIRHPSVIEGKPIDIQKLSEKHTAFVVTEGTRSVTDPKTGKTTTIYEQGKKEITAGYTAKAGAITLIRPEPGFQYAVQTPEGFRLGSEYTYARGEETFHGFINYLQQSRTTKRFTFYSLDRQRAEMTVQLTWIMKDGERWLTKGRAYDDPFDMLEEKAEAFFRDAVGAMDHQKALKEKSDGFNTIEIEIFTKLANAAASLGAKLISLEVRELSFPQLESQEVTLAAKEAETRAKKLEAQREIELRKLEDEKLAALEVAKQERAQAAAYAAAMQMKISDEAALAQVEAQSKQALARQRGKAEEEKARLQSEQEIQVMKGETAKLVAQNEAEVLAVKIRMENQMALEKAQAEATASEAIAKVLVNNPALLELKKMEIWADVEKERFRTLALFAKNPEALLPESMQRDLIRMRHGAHPQEFFPLTPGAGAPAPLKSIKPSNDD